MRKHGGVAGRRRSRNFKACSWHRTLSELEPERLTGKRGDFRPITGLVLHARRNRESFAYDAGKSGGAAAVLFAGVEERIARAAFSFVPSQNARGDFAFHTAIADMAILHTQAEVHDRDVPRVWMVLDEAATMGRIGQLESGMTKQRASGNPIVLGFHDLPQLEQRYGEKGAQTITAQAYTNIIVGTGSDKEALHIEKMIGHEEIDRVTENRPWHLMLFNKGHRARSVTNQITTTAPVTAAEIQAYALSRLHAARGPGTTVQFPSARKEGHLD